MSFQTPFMKFWADLNAVMVAHRLPEMLYGEARNLWSRDAWVPDATGLVDTNTKTGEMRA